MSKKNNAFGGEHGHGMLQGEKGLGHKLSVSPLSLLPTGEWKRLNKQLSPCCFWEL